jgi:cysteine synthase A
MPGNTPLIEVEGILAKLECTNPCGSIKDRIAVHILEESERQGILDKGTRIVEATSGNTGIAFAFFARERGYRVTIVMPENMTDERKEILRSLGVDLVLCSKEGSFAEAATIRDRLATENGWFNPDQFSNPLNVDCHYRTTGEEILSQVEERGRGPVGAFVAGIGTGGTIMGVGKRLREASPSVYLVAVEPLESAIMSGGPAGAHDIQGIGDGFIPAIASDGKGGVAELIDEVIAISSDDAKAAAEYLRETHGCCVGVSSGANFLAAKRLQERFGTVVTVFPDGYRKYQSMGLRHCKQGECPFEHDPVV